jgi:hypothetical protein
VKVVVAPVLLSVTVIVQAAEPVVSVAVAEVLETTVGVVKLSPEQPAPLTLNKPLAVSWVQTVLPPVSVTPGVVLIAPEFGEMASVAVATVTFELIESVVSLTESVPIPEPVAIVTVSDVLDEFE